jgi:hypothetical protein
MRYLTTWSLVLALGLAGASVAAQPATAPDRQLTVKDVDGRVRAIDRQTKALRVGSTRGLGDTMLQVTDNTQIRVEGREGSLAEVREGARVKASYEDRYGINVARSIEVMPAEGRGHPDSPGASPARPDSPSGGPAGQPGTR